MQIYQDGTGQLVIDGKTATGTDLRAIASDLELRITGINVSHGMTALAHTNVAAILGIARLAEGGADLEGLAEGKEGLRLRSRVTTVETSRLDNTVAALIFEGALKSGTTRTFLTSGANLAVFRNFSNNKLYIDDNGSLIPGLGTGHDLGDSTDFWDDIWANNVRTTFLLPKVGGNQAIVVSIASGDQRGFEFISPAIAHGMTTNIRTDAGGNISLASATSGGLEIAGWDEGDRALRIVGIVTNDNALRATNATAPIQLQGAIKSGTTVGDLAVDKNLLVVQNNVTTRFILDSDGDSHQDVGTAWTNFDDENDAVLLRDLANAVSPDSVRTKFGEFIFYNKGELERLGLVSFEGPTPFVNMSRLTMLHTGAIWQLYTRIDSLEQRLLALESGR